MKSELAALNENWLNATNTSTNCVEISETATSPVVSNSGCVSGWYYNNYPWYITHTVSHRPIRLTLPEVERLRLAAKRDAKLKAILAKFTDQIEVELDFS